MPDVPSVPDAAQEFLDAITAWQAFTANPVPNVAAYDAAVDRLEAAEPALRAALAAALPTPTDESWLRERIAEVLDDYLPDAVAYQWAQPVARELVHRLPHVFAGQLTASAIRDALDEAKRIAGLAVDSAQLLALADELATLLVAAPPDDEPARPASVGIAPQRIAHLAALTDDWDSYGGKPPTDEALRVARSLNTVPTSNGGIQFVWHANGWDVEVEVEPDGQPSFWAHHRESGQMLTDGAAAGSPPPTPDDPKPLAYANFDHRDEIEPGVVHVMLRADVGQENLHIDGEYAIYRRNAGPPPTNGPTRQQIDGRDPDGSIDAQTVIAAYLANQGLVAVGEGWEQHCEDMAIDILSELRAAGLVYDGASPRPDNDPEEP